MLEDIRPPKRPARLEENAPTISAKTEAKAIPIDLAVPHLKSSTSSKRKRSFHIWPSHLSKKKQIILGIVIALITIGTVGATAYFTYFKKPPTTQQSITPPPKEPEEPPKPVTEASRLTGVQITPELNQRPVTGVMIENSPDARPQAGLKDAGVVYEAVAEGGITRFLALFQEAQPDRIGPVRSARPYYLDWLLPFDAAYAHAGGSADALSQIKALGIKDMDQFANGAYYTRVKERFAPHNLYTSMAKLDELKNKKGFTTSNFTGFARKADDIAPTPTAKSIDFTISSALYNVHYDYDVATNSYMRSLGGKPHKDEKSGSVLNPKVVVALVMNKGANGVYSTYASIGSGAMFVFQDGRVTQGTWQKTSRQSQFVFNDITGAPFKFNAGQTWISIIDKSSAATYKP